MIGSGSRNRLPGEIRRDRAAAAWVGGLLVAWVALYRQLQPLSVAFTRHALGIRAGSRVDAAVQCFVWNVPRLLLLLPLVVFTVSLLRSYFSPRRARRLLAGRREAAGNVLAALLGVATPFCSCSAVPLFLGFMEAGIPLGVCFSFLLASPMVNEVALVLLLGLFGWQIALLYVGTGLLLSILAGWLLGRLGMERYVESWVSQAHTHDIPARNERFEFADRVAFAGRAVREVMGRVWPYILIGLSLGLLVRLYVPEGALAALMGRRAWWAVPFAVAVGVPIYSSAAGIVPLVHALLLKGAGIGTALAFMMAVTGLSLPEWVILRRVLKPRLIGVFIGIVATGIALTGWTINAASPLLPHPVLASGPTQVLILGEECEECARLMANTAQAVREIGLPARVEKVTDLQVIVGRYHVAQTPALVVDGRVKSSGRVLSPAEVKRLLAR